MEIWKDIEGYEGQYQVSDKGNIRSLDRVIVLKDRIGNNRPSLYKGRVLRQNINTKGRKCVVLSKNSKTSTKEVHRVVANTFIENPLSKKTVNHIDGNRLNNDVTNLEWSTYKENNKHAFDNKLIPTQKIVLKIDKHTLEIIEEIESESEACRIIGVSQGKVGRAIKRNGTCKGYKWKYK